MYNKATINQVADVVRKILDYKDPPYDPVDAVNRLNGIIDNEVADVAIDASIERCKTNGKAFIIHLNKEKPFLRTRFSIAHELGHLFLHMGYRTPRWENTEECFKDSVYYRYERMPGTYTTEESEANEFAAAFLMPMEEFKKAVYDNTSDGIVDFLKVAEKFEVSTEAALNRARFSGITG